MSLCARSGSTSIVIAPNCRSWLFELSASPRKSAWTWRPVARIKTSCMRTIVWSCPSLRASAARAVNMRSIRSPGCNIPESAFTSSTAIVIARNPVRKRWEKCAASEPAIATVNSGSPDRTDKASVDPMYDSNRSGEIPLLGARSVGIWRTAMVSALTGSPRCKSRLATTTPTIATSGCKRSRSSANARSI